MKKPVQITFPHCTVLWEPEHRRVVTRFHDGTESYAVAHDTPEYHSHAAEKSTGDIDTYAWQHDVSHCIAALMAHGGPSVVLWNLAHGLSSDTPDCDAEEQAAQEFQRRFFLR